MYNFDGGIGSGRKAVPVAGIEWCVFPLAVSRADGKGERDEKETGSINDS